MIHESGPWRNLLIKDAEIIESWATKTAITERRSVIMERKAFLAAYTIRKLWDARKLTSGTESKKIACKTFPARQGKYISSWNVYKFDELYDLSAPSPSSINIRDLLNLFIH
jgi:hypothetical protein